MSDGSTDASTPAAEPPRDPLTVLRDELDEVHQLPVADRVARFERANDVLASELAALDEV